MKTIKKSNKLIVFADKTNNAYKVDKDDYNKLLRENITKTYKRAPSNVLDDINEEAECIANNLNLCGKVQKYTSNSGFITFKDHKPDFKRTLKMSPYQSSEN